MYLHHTSVTLYSYPVVFINSTVLMYLHHTSAFLDTLYEEVIKLMPTEYQQPSRRQCSADILSTSSDTCLFLRWVMLIHFLGCQGQTRRCDSEEIQAFTHTLCDAFLPSHMDIWSWVTTFKSMFPMTSSKSAGFLENSTRLTWCPRCPWNCEIQMFLWWN